MQTARKWDIKACNCNETWSPDEGSSKEGFCDRDAETFRVYVRDAEQLRALLQETPVFSQVRVR